MSRKAVADGRPTKATPERIEAICHLLAKGNTRTTAAAMCDVARGTLWRWMAEDETFRDAVEKAESDAQKTLLHRILMSAETGMTVTRQNGDTVEYPGQWTAAAWILERRWPELYGRRDTNKVELTGRDGGPIETADVPTVKDDHEKRLLRDAIRRELERETVPA